MAQQLVKYQIKSVDTASRIKRSVFQKLDVHPKASVEIGQIKEKEGDRLSIRLTLNLTQQFNENRANMYAYSTYSVHGAHLNRSAKNNTKRNAVLCPKSHRSKLFSVYVCT